jgi:X-linked retinitis pigmentosa GTPase regulator
MTTETQKLSKKIMSATTVVIDTIPISDVDSLSNNADDTAPTTFPPPIPLTSLSGEKRLVPTPNAPNKKNKAEVDDVDDVDDFYDEEKSEDDDDAGSLEDFIVNDEPDDNEKETSDEPEECVTLTKEESNKRDLEDINSSNILTGKRTRKPVKRFEDDLFQSEEYKKMMLCDIPEDELNAALEDDFSSDEEEGEEDDDYEDENGNENEDQEETESEDEDSSENEDETPEKKDFKQ